MELHNPSAPETHGVVLGQVLSNVVASPDAQLVLTVGADKSTPFAKLWDPDGPTLQRKLRGGLPFEFWSVAVSPDKKWALDGCYWPSTTPGEVRLWELETGRVKHSLPGREGWWGQVLAFSPDSRLALVTKSEYGEKSHIKTHLALWDVRSGKILRMLDGEGAPACFTADGKQLVGISGHGPGKGEAVFWDAGSGRIKRTVSFAFPWQEYSQFFLSGDGQLALAAVGEVFEGRWGTERHRDNQLTLAIWDLDTGRLVSQWTRPRADP